MSARVYTCSSVNVDYFKYLNDCLEAGGIRAEPLYYLTEHEYRTASKRRGMRKIALRLQMYLAYPMKLLFRGLLAPREAIFIVTSNTFFAPLLIAVIGKLKGYKTVHLVYDLFPDAMEVSGALPPNSAKARMIGRFTRLTQKLCRGSVFLGDFLRTHAEQRWGAAPPARRIDIGADSTKFADHEPKETAGPLTFHYGGQLGYMHDATALIRSVKESLGEKQNQESSCRFHFLTSGAQAERLKNELAGLPVEVADAIPSDQWRELIKGFQVGLVTLSPGGATVCLPSKTYAMMAGGLAILAICPIWSDLARLILDNDGGWVINNSAHKTETELKQGNYLQNVCQKRPDAEISAEFAQMVRFIQSNPALLMQKRRNARACALNQYSPAAISQTWRAFVGEVEALR